MHHLQLLIKPFYFDMSCMHIDNDPVSMIMRLKNNDNDDDNNNNNNAIISEGMLLWKGSSSFL